MNSFPNQSFKFCLSIFSVHIVESLGGSAKSPNVSTPFIEVKFRNRASERATDCLASLHRWARSGDKYRFEAKSIAAKGSEEIREGENTSEGESWKKAATPLLSLFLTLSPFQSLSVNHSLKTTPAMRGDAQMGERRKREGRDFKKRKPCHSERIDRSGAKRWNE